MGVDGNESSLASPYILEEARVLQREETNLGLPPANLEVKLAVWVHPYLQAPSCRWASRALQQAFCRAPLGELPPVYDTVSSPRAWQRS